MFSIFICARNYGASIVKQMTLFGPASTQSTVTSRKKDTWKLYIDGAARNNPGPAGVGIHILKNGESFERIGYYIGPKTNNQAEYFALLLGMLTLKKYVHSHDEITICSDSLLLVKQLTGEYKVKHPDLKQLFSLAHALLYSVGAHIHHVYREDNVIADKMANQGIDKKIPVPPAFIEELSKHEVSL